LSAARHSIPSVILFAGDLQWQIALCRNRQITFTDVPLDAGATPAQIARSVMPALERLSYQGQPAFLAIPASWCIAATIDIADLPRGDQKAMLYRLEEELPVAAEDIIADFVLRSSTQKNADTALGISVSTDLLKPLVDALEAAGIRIQSISPIVLCAAQSLIDDTPLTPLALLARESDEGEAQISVVTIESGTLTGWALLAADAEDLRLSLKMMVPAANADWRYEAMSVAPHLIQAVAKTIDAPIELRKPSVSEAAASFGDAVLAGRTKPWIEFRRGALAVGDRLRQHRTSLNRLLVAAIVLMAVSTSVTFIRAQRYIERQAAIDDQLAQTFHEAFPGWAVPTNLKAVVEAEHRKAQTSTGQSLPAEGQGSAVQTLHDVLTRLPADGHYTLDTMSFEPDAFQIEGRIQSYEQVDALAGAAKDAGLLVETPLTRRGSDGFWNFTLHGTRPLAAAAAVASKGIGG
jgi:hypothetical protein